MAREPIESDRIKIERTHWDDTANAREEVHTAWQEQSLQRNNQHHREPTELDTSGLESLYKGQENLSYSSQKQRFDQLLKAHPEISRNLTENLADLEKRLAGRPDAQDQTAAVLESVNDLLDQEHQAILKDPAKQAEVAAGILEHAAHPEAINQGAFNSCAFATMETEVYTRTPGTAAKLVAAVAITGKFTTQDSVTLEVDKDTINRPHDAPNPILPEMTERVGQRDQASQIFQATAFNVALANGAKPQLHFSLREPNSLSPSGEFVGAEGEFEANQIFQKIPAIRDYDTIYKKITGQQSNGVLSLGDGANSDEFASALAKAKTQGRMPIAIAINSTSEIVKDSLTEDGAIGAMMSGIGAHLITITDYNPQSQTVYFRNHLNGAQAQEISSADLYNNMTYCELDTKEMNEFIKTVTEKLKDKPFDKLDMEITLRQIYPEQRKEIAERLSESIGVDILAQFSKRSKERLELE